MGSKVIQGSAGGKAGVKVLMVNGYIFARINQGQPGVKLLINTLWQPNLVGRILDQLTCGAFLGSKVMQNLAGVNHGSNCLGIPFGSQIWLEEPLTLPESNALMESKVIQGSPGVNKREIAQKFLKPPKLM